MAGTLFVANAGEDSISAISTREQRQIKRFDVGQSEPSRLLLHEGLLYCANASTGSVSRMRPDGSRCLTRCAGTGPHVMVARQNKLFVICNDSDSVWRYDTRGFMPETAAACGPWPIDLVSFGGGIAVAKMMSSAVCCFDDELRAGATAELDLIPLCMAVTHAPSGERLIACGMVSDDVGRCAVLGPDTKTLYAMRTPWPISAVVPLLWQNAGIALAVWQNRVCKLDWERRRVVWQTQTGRMPESVLVDERMGRIYVSCLQDACVEIYDMSGQLRARVPTGREPRGMALGNVGKMKV